MNIPKKIAFIHIARTAGGSILVNIQPFLAKKNYKIFNSWKTMNRDWNQKELLSFIDENQAFVHNHSFNWNRKTFYKYKKNEWFTFAFVRHPGDRLCSEYFYFHSKNPTFNLDKFIKHKLLKSNKNKIPNYWKDIDFIEEYTQENIIKFLKNYLHIDKKLKIIKKSENKGYEHYYKTNQISKDAQILIKNSKEYLIYLKITGKNKQEYYLLRSKKLFQKFFDFIFPKKPL
ncbi:hypothetical protein CMI43_02405 [Candidatus Pacearchaeota archaeon]|nr:hypothetical protein [Candidatus Pacearchaeota archaeon]|tara:strand:+ start:8083 stop:8772 length:690 start_codon:yes stop_codon:yes gene_type:complete